MMLALRRTLQSDVAFFGLLGGLILLAYLALHGIYRPDNKDDAWFLSFAYSHVVQGVESDVVFGSRPGTGGYGGVLLFGKTYSYLYGYVLNALGWTKSNGHLISTVCILLSAICWGLLLRKNGQSRLLSGVFACALLLVEPYFGAANQARPDALSFLLVSGSALAFSFNRYVAAGLLAAIAVEIHPVGISALLLIAALAVARQQSDPFDRRTLVLAAVGLLAGLLIGAAYYYGLHADHLSLLLSTLTSGNAGAGGSDNILIEYFLKTKHFRHVPELVVFVACTVWFVKRRYYRETWLVPALFVACMAFALIVQRPNFMYTIYVYPGFLLLTLWLCERNGWLKAAGLAVLVYLIPQYAIVFAQNRSWDMAQYVAQVRAAVGQHQEPIVGNPNDWFAFQQREFYSASYHGDLRPVLPGQFVLIESDHYRDGEYPRMTALVNESYRIAETVEFQSRGKPVRVHTMQTVVEEPSAQ